MCSKFHHQTSLLSNQCIENALEDALAKGKTTSKVSERTLHESVRSLGLLLSGCDCRAVFAALDPEGKGAVTVDTVMDFILNGKSGNLKDKDKSAARYVIRIMFCFLSGGSNNRFEAS